jgi:hypothetical protein
MEEVLTYKQEQNTKVGVNTYNHVFVCSIFRCLYKYAHAYVNAYTSYVNMEEVLT